VLAWTEWAARSLREDYGVPAEKIAVVHPGVDVAAWATERPAPSAYGPLRILLVGNFVERKGLRTLMAALPLVDRPVELHVVTNDARVDVPDEVVVHRGLAPGSAELRRQYAEADAFAFPTAADAVPWAVAEAMAAGLPVVASDVGAIHEMLGDDAGVLVPRGDAGALARALRDLADDPSRRATLGQRARARAHERYDQERQMSRIADVLRAACQHHDGGGS
jgi:glycosyltransferase involved in cell wall biosynthesis